MSARPWLPSLVSFAALACLAAAMIAWTWATWPHAFVDFGRELYVPWRITEGERLYADLAWFNGPWSAHRNALLFLVFGPGLWVLVVANAIDVVLVVVLLHALLVRVADRSAAFAGCALFLVLFAFDRIDSIGNDNWLTPYSHELPHGVLLGLMALLAFTSLRRPRRAAAVSGLLLGLAFLTKPEPFLAALAGVTCSFALDARARRLRATEVATRVSLGLVALAIPVAASVGLLALAMPWPDALRGTLGAWPAVFASEVSSEYFYRATLGWVGLEDNVVKLLGWGAAWTLVLGLVTLAGLRVRPRSNEVSALRRASYLGAGLFAAVLAVCFGVWLAATWPDVLRPAPVAASALAAGAIFQALRTRDERVITAAGLLVFGAVLLAKVLLRVRIDQYGFALAMPAAVLFVAAGSAWLPMWIGHRGGDARLARALFLGAVTGVVLSLLPLIAARIDERSFQVAEGRDAFLTDPHTGRVLRDLLATLADREPGETLVVLPEGVMINYLSRRVNPTGHLNFMPPELAIFGEDAILESLRANPPDLVALTHKDTREYGVGFFGRGYGRSLLDFVEAGYVPIGTWGDPPLRPGSRFGVTLLERREAAPGPGPALGRDGRLESSEVR